MKLSAVLITKNEETNMTDCLRSVMFCDEIIVVDSGSSDQTTSIASQYGSKVFQNPFVDFASQKNFGISKAGGEWVFLIDADERVTTELAEEILKSIRNERCMGYWVRRRNRIFGRWMNGGANRHDWQMRLVRRQRARFGGKVHERIHVSGLCKYLKGRLNHLSTENISRYMKKLKQYTDFEIEEISKRSQNAAITPSLSKPVALFLKSMILQRGFRDGMEGFFFTVLSCYYEFVRQIKYWEKSCQS
jgi:glycosyltransferase involved in cell wall biosynthesis